MTEAVNPLKRLRLKADLTVSQLTELGAGSRVFILNAEAGVYSDPPDRVLNLLLDQFPYADAEELIEEYHAWQTAHRKSNYGALDPEWLGPAAISVPSFNFTDTPHPFYAWRIYSGITSRVKPSKLFCVHPTVLTRFELQPWLVNQVPPMLIKALTEAGYSKEVLDVFQYRWVHYKDYLSRKALAP